MGKTTGARLNDAMRASGVGTRKLARAAGIDAATVTRLRKGDGNGSLDSWRRIAGALDCSMDALGPGIQPGREG